MKANFLRSLLLLFFSMLFFSCTVNETEELLDNDIENIDNNTNPEDSENDNDTDDNSEGDDNDSDDDGEEEENNTATLIGNWILADDNSTLIISNYQEDRYRYNHGTSHFYNHWYPNPNHDNYVLLYNKEESKVTFKYLNAVYAGMRFYNYASYKITKLTQTELILDNDRNDLRIYKRN